MTAAAESAISVEGVSKRFRIYHERNQSIKAAVMRGGRATYEEFWALRDVSLEIPRGKTFGLIGENGSGKSTLLKCIAKILQPEEGSVTSRGKIAALLELGSGFHPELSGRENVYLNGSILGVSERELDARFDDIVGFAGLERFIDTPVKNYSSGMYVRLGFSVAINVDPEILLVDEVLAVGDESFQRRCNEKFAEFKADGRTIVLVSHALGSMRNMCDEVAWLEHGEVREVGTPGGVVDEYMGASHDEREVDDAGGGESGSRWGSGEGRIERIEVLDRAGQPTTQVRTGETVTFRFHYQTRRPIEQPVFGMAIYSIEGQHVTGPNTRDAGAVPRSISGNGTVDLTVDRLMLVPGTYDLSASLFDYSCLHAFDFRHRAHRFDVELGEPREQYGLVALGGTWKVDALEDSR